MKKVLSLILSASFLVCSVSLFADTDKAAQTPTIVVQSVTGKVQREVSADKWKAVTKMTELDATTVVSTGLNSTLVLVVGGKTVTITGMQKGTVETLIAAASTDSGIKLGAKAVDSDVSANSDQKRTNISTASTRASDATKDVEWAEGKEK